MTRKCIKNIRVKWQLSIHIFLYLPNQSNSHMTLSWFVLPRAHEYRLIPIFKDSIHHRESWASRLCSLPNPQALCWSLWHLSRALGNTHAADNSGPFISQKFRHSLGRFNRSFCGRIIFSGNQGVNSAEGWIKGSLKMCSALLILESDRWNFVSLGASKTSVVLTNPWRLPTVQSKEVAKQKSADVTAYPGTHQ